MRNAQSRFGLVANLFIVFIVPSYPERPPAILVPALWSQIQVVIVDVEDFVAARVRR
jgi:hypothetical protein